MKTHITVESPPADAELPRILAIEEELARVSVNSRRHRELTSALHVEADAYRRSLDAQQALATHDARAERAVNDATSSRHVPDH